MTQLDGNYSNSLRQWFGSPTGNSKSYVCGWVFIFVLFICVHQACMLRFWKGLTPRHFFVGKGRGHCKFLLERLKGTKANDQGAWRLSPFLPLLSIRPDTCNLMPEWINWYKYQHAVYIPVHVDFTHKRNWPWWEHYTMYSVM